MQKPDTETNQTVSAPETRDIDIIQSGGNYYVAIRGFVYTLRAFGLKGEAEEYAEHLYLGVNNKTEFLPEYGWSRVETFGAYKRASAPVNAQAEWNCIHCNKQFTPTPYKVKKHYHVCDDCVRQRAIARKGNAQTALRKHFTRKAVQASQSLQASLQQRKARLHKGNIAGQIGATLAGQITVEPKEAQTTPIVEKIGKATKAQPKVDANAKYVPQNGEVDELKLNVKCQLNSLLTGPTQCGKTTLSEFVAEDMGRELITVQGGDGATFERIIAKDVLKEENGVTITVRPSVKNPETWSVLPQAMDKGAILYIDEPNMIPAEVLAYLFSAMDKRHCITFDDGTKLKAKEGFCVICAMNEGQGYTGTTALNSAFRARSQYVLDMDYLPKTRESALVVARTGIDKAMADKLCECVAQLRASAKAHTISTPIGTSAVLACAQRLVEGAPLWPTLRGCIINQVPSTKQKERNAVTDVIAAYFGKEGK